MKKTIDSVDEKINKLMTHLSPYDSINDFKTTMEMIKLLLHNHEMSNNTSWITK
jgi:hypothetical protein